MIVTDHAPHSAEEKARPMAQAPSGITGRKTVQGYLKKKAALQNKEKLKRAGLE